MDYYLGFDGGGTKTDCVVLNEAGDAAGQSTAGPSNPLRIGFDAAFAALEAAAADALAGAHLEKQHVRAVCAGLAGGGRLNVVQRAEEFLRKSFPGAFVRVTTDLEVALEAAAGPRPGVVLIAGTGSSAFGHNAAGQTARAGGYGPWIGDEGSAFEIGRRAVSAALQMRDYAGPATRLVDLILGALQCPGWGELTERIARNPDDVFPKVFPVLVDAAEAGDRVSREILFSSAVALSSIALTVIRRLELKDQEFVLAKCGGVFGRSRMLDATLDSVLLSAAPRAKIGPLEVSAAVGAARLAKRLSSHAPFLNGPPCPAAPGRTTGDD